MLQKIHKLYLNYEKEEQWLNEMSAKGLQFVGYTWGTYLFEPGEPGAYRYRIELLENPSSHPESQQYLNFMEESGVTPICSYLNWVYFKKPASQGAFDLYSDLPSRIRHYQRVAKLLGIILGANLFVGLFNVVIGIVLGSINTQLGMINLLLAVVLIPIFIRFFRKIRRLKREQSIYQE